MALLLACALPATLFAAPAAAFSSGIDPHLYDVTEDGGSVLKQVLASHPFAEIEAAAQAGVPEAMYLTAVAKWLGVGTAVDLPSGRALMRKAALAGFHRALFSYGMMLAQGVGGEKAPDEAVSWWEQADQAGVVPAAFALAEYYRSGANRDPAKAKPYYDKAAARGLQAAKLALADYLFEGIGVPRDTAAAVAAYKAVAAEGYGPALYKLGSFYDLGTARQPAEALAYYRQAAEKGVSGAAYQAGRLLVDANGVPPDPPAAAKILRAAPPDDWKSQDLLAKLIVNRTIPPIRGVDAEALAMQAQEHGAPESYGALISNLREGRNGYKRDLRRAGLMARTALANIKRLPKSADGAWPMHAQGAAYTISMAIGEHAIIPQPGEVEELKNRYSLPYLSGGLNQGDVIVLCAGVRQPFHIYFWNALAEVSMVDDQFDWAEQAMGCVVPAETRERFRRLYDISLATDLPFTGMVIAYLQQPNPKPLSTPIEF